MTGEYLILIAALVDIFFVFLVAQRQPQRLVGVVVINLILITIFGSKLITLFGVTTNAGNVFYACVFLATHFILERKDQKEVYSVIWMGVLSLIFFLALSQLAILFPTASLTSSLDAAMHSVFVLSPRIAGASIVAYIFAQSINISVYRFIQRKTKGRMLWLRTNGANILAQLVDSCIFFTFAFFDLSGTVLVQAILIGWAVKTAVVLLGTPFLYLDRYLLARE